jgi:hypothetical protein
MNDQRNMKIFALTLVAIIFLLIILVIMLPILIKSKIESNLKERTTPHSDNTNLWAKFPGDIKTKMIHTFKFLDYSENNPKIEDLLA